MSKHGIAIYRRSKKGDVLIDFKETEPGKQSLNALFYYRCQGDTKRYRFEEEVITDEVFSRIKEARA